MGICIAGYGTMGKVIAKALLKDKDNNVSIYDPSERVQAQAEVDGFQDIMGLGEYYQKEQFMPLIEHIEPEERQNDDLNSVHIFFLCMKPQDIPSFFNAYVSTLLQDISDKERLTFFDDYKILFTSIAAGVSLASLKKHFETALEIYGASFPSLETSKKISFVRIMPNLASSVGKGAGAVTYSENILTNEKIFIEKLLEKLGTYLELDEKHMDAVTALSGSAPAFLLVALDAMADSGVEMGLSRKDALTLATETLCGTGHLALKTGEHPMVLKDKVASPAGTTIAGLRALDDSNFRQGLKAAILAAYKRSRHLNKTAQRRVSERRAETDTSG